MAIGLAFGLNLNAITYMDYLCNRVNVLFLLEIEVIGSV